jgi:fructokinase
LAFLTRVDDIDEGVRLLHVPVGSLVIVTLGANGAAFYRDGEKLVNAPSFPVKVVETTGCGDSFMAAILSQLAGKTAKEIASLTPEQLEPIARFANAEAAIVATRYGAADANPTRAEVEAFLASR